MLLLNRIPLQVYTLKLLEIKRNDQKTEFGLCKPYSIRIYSLYDHSI